MQWENALRLLWEMPCRALLPDMSSYGAAAIAVVRMCEHLAFTKGLMRPRKDLRCEVDRRMPATYMLPMRAAMTLQLLDGTELEDMLPCICLGLHSILVIHKPPGWEIDVQHCASARLLSFWLERILSNMLCFQSHDGVHSSGFIHRLDAPCSGLLLVSQTHEAG